MEENSKTQTNSFFVKERGSSSNTKKRTRHGIVGSIPYKECSDRKKESYDPVVGTVVKLYDTYKYSQNKVDSAMKSETEDVIQDVDVLTKVSDFVITLISFNNKDFQVYVKGAEAHKGSICSEIILLNNTLKELKEKTLKGEDLLKAQTEVEQLEERFANYKLGTKQPVDSNADAFVSHVIPMMLAYYGHKADTSFSSFLIDELEKNNLPIPLELKNLQKNSAVRKPSVSTAKKTLDTKFVLSRVLKNYGIEEKFEETLLKTTDKSLEEFFELVSGFVQIEVQNVDDLTDITKDKTLNDILLLSWQFHNKQLDETFVNEIEQSFNETDSEFRKTEEGKKSTLLFATYRWYKNKNESKDKTKETKTAKAPKKTGNASVSMNGAPKKPATTQQTSKTETNVNAKEKVSTEPQTNNLGKDETKTGREEKMEETQKTSEIATSKQDDKKEVSDNQPNVEKKQTTDIVSKTKNEEKSIKDEDFDSLMMEYALDIFMSQKDYNLPILSEVEIEVTKRVYNEEIKSIERPFGDVLNSTKHAVLNGKDTVVLKSLPETYADVRESFMSLDSRIQNALLRGLDCGQGVSYVALAKQKCQNMINNYETLSDEEKSIINGFASRNSKIKKDLHEGRIESAKRKERDVKTMLETMKRYGYSKSDIEPNKDVEESVTSFYGMLK